MIPFLLISAAIAAISTTLTQTYIFKPLRVYLISKSTFLGKLFKCPYCLNHYLAIIGATILANTILYFIIYTFALVTASTIFCYPILLYLNELEKE